MSGWRVDPDRVVGILAGVDDEGARLAQAVTDTDALAWNHAATLSVDGRTAVLHAWQAFFDDRRLVPGKLIHVVTRAASAVTEATTAVVAGDETMAGDSRRAEEYALENWGIDSPWAYQVGAG
jgi:hypothetical protein